MAKYKHSDSNQNLLIAVSLENQLMPGTLEFAIHTLVETRMDLSVFDQNFNNDDTGRRAYHPKVLLKIVLLAYSRGLISSRSIERACIENVTFMAISGNQRPDHSTIAAFVSTMADQIIPLFRDILLVCAQEDLLGGTFFALDGLRLPSNASKKSSGTFSDLKKQKEKIEHRVEQLLKEQIKTDRQHGSARTDTNRRQRQIDKLQKQAERIDRWLEENEPQYGTTGKELKSNVTDNDSAKMLSSHGTIQGYNSQAVVDRKHQVIVSAEAFGSGQDHKHLPSMVDQAKDNLKRIGKDDDCLKDKVFTADSNYHSQANIKKCQDEQLDAYIPDNHFRSRDKRFAGQKKYRPKKKRKFALQDFKHDKIKDYYICPNGKILRCKLKEHIHDHNIYRRYMADANDCKDCLLKDQCFYRKNTKRRTLDVPIGVAASNLSKAMQQKIDSPRGRRIYPQRLGIVEPVFANIRVQKRLDRFTLRSKIKVNIQWLLYCMVHNIEKIARVAWA